MGTLDSQVMVQDLRALHLGSDKVDWDGKSCPAHVGLVPSQLSKIAHSHVQVR